MVFFVLNGIHDVDIGRDEVIDGQPVQALFSHVLFIAFYLLLFDRLLLFLQLQVLLYKFDQLLLRKILILLRFIGL